MPLLIILLFPSLGGPFGELKLLVESLSSCGLRLGVKILTCDNLMRRGFNLASWCCMCQNAGETGPHLLIHCGMASDLWHLVLRSFGVLWVFPNNIADLLFGWFNCFGKQNSSIWNLVPHCLMWTVWRDAIVVFLKIKITRRPSFRNYFLVSFLIGLGSGDLL